MFFTVVFLFVFLCGRTLLIGSRKLLGISLGRRFFQLNFFFWLSWYLKFVLVVTFGFEASGVSSSVMVVSTTGSVKFGNSGTCDDCQTLKPPASTITAARHPAKAFSCL